MLKVATWNVNSLKVRIDQVIDWVVQQTVDIVMLQETKLTDEQFPVARFTDLGFHVAFSGQKTYNGVAIISRYPLAEIETDFPDFDDPQRRLLAVTVAGMRLINVYVPNGAAVDSDKYAYKLEWLSHLKQYLTQQLRHNPQVLVAGDFNIAPQDSDVHDPQAWAGSVLVSDRERAALQALLQLGFIDGFRYLSPETVAYSWWDYRAAAFRRNLGLRIDLVLLSQALVSQCVDISIDVQPRGHERPSDHAPVIAVMK